MAFRKIALAAIFVALPMHEILADENVQNPSWEEIQTGLLKVFSAVWGTPNVEKAMTLAKKGSEVVINAHSQVGHFSTEFLVLGFLLYDSMSVIGFIFRMFFQPELYDVMKYLSAKGYEYEVRRTLIKDPSKTLNPNSTCMGRLSLTKDGSLRHGRLPQHHRRVMKTSPSWL